MFKIFKEKFHLNRYFSSIYHMARGDDMFFLWREEVSIGWAQRTQPLTAI